tara:strand:- start:114 stop:770 length:657 start_codon:yes stop_codon:yes gene_type:complete
MRILIIVSGEHIQGRLILSGLLKNSFNNIFLIKEENTKLAKKHDEFLKEISLKVPFFCNMNIEINKTNKLNKNVIIEAINKFRPNFIIQGGVGIIEEEVLNLGFFLNVHPGILPNYRGLDPVLWSIYNDEPVGATIHKIDSSIDTGPVLLSEKLPYKYKKRIIDLRLQCMEWGSKLLIKFLKKPDDYSLTPQNPEHANYFGVFPKDKINLLEKKLQKI